MRASTAAGPLHDFYENLLAKGRKPTMARLTLARKVEWTIVRLVVSENDGAVTTAEWNHREEEFIRRFTRTNYDPTA